MRQTISCKLGCWARKFEREDVEELKKLFPFHFENFVIYLDEDRIEEGTEAWIPVKMETRYGLSSHCLEIMARWIDGKKGFLAIGNCD